MGSGAFGLRQLLHCQDARMSTAFSCVASARQENDDEFLQSIRFAMPFVLQATSIHLTGLSNFESITDVTYSQLRTFLCAQNPEAEELSLASHDKDNPASNSYAVTAVAVVLRLIDLHKHTETRGPHEPSPAQNGSRRRRLGAEMGRRSAVKAALVCCSGSSLFLDSICAKSCLEMHSCV